MIFLNVRTRFCCHIDLLTHREAVTGYPAGHRLASFYPLGYKRFPKLSPISLPFCLLLLLQDLLGEPRVGTLISSLYPVP